MAKNLSETEIVHRQHIIAEAVEDELFIHYIKGYLGGYKSALLYGAAEAFMERFHPEEKTLASEAKEG
tara:strand:- start:55 stop:258 length:204 start_codon:yes stop_codon:yes gene_type:complete